ncbi:MAG: 23S rRNA (uracil(1939)-C(5))-methyltransferase RlmD [Paludibacteraceae bacterium]|nr:23S rRNA (uracil(1939)-C(5))-methyltransferase RlmD [Paludibacteraceae bacterium]
MGRRNLPIIEDIEITGIAAEGKALARVDDIVCFVPYCVPGDIVDLQVTKKKHSFMEARVLRYKHLSETRCEAVCPHYGLCGGCKWQILPYTEQLRWKQQQIEDNLRRIGKIELPEISPILGSKKIYEYRNKLEFAFADHKWLTTEQMKSGIPFEPGVGFHIPNCFDKVLQIDECHLMEGLQNDIRNGVYAFAREHGMTFYNERSHTGQLRNLMIRNNNEGEWMVVVVFAEPLDNNAKALLDMIKTTWQQVTCLMYCINQKMNDTIGDQDVLLWSGKDHIMEKMEDLQFKVGPKSFYQTNTDQAYELYSVARKFAQLTGKEVVYDLYTGTGTIANFVARQAKKVVGIEYVPEAIEDAKINAQLNGLDNTEFFAGDMKDVLNADFIAQHGKPEVIITDPPRAGMHEDVIKVILAAAPKRIVYVSCNPATQARDLAMMDEHYQVIAVQPVDMFPHTQHVENVVVLQSKDRLRLME